MSKPEWVGILEKTIKENEKYTSELISGRSALIPSLRSIHINSRWQAQSPSCNTSGQ